MKRKQLKRIRITALVLAAVMLIVTAAFCLGNLITHNAEVHRQEEIFDELAEAAEETPIVESAPDNEEETLSNLNRCSAKIPIWWAGFRLRERASIILSCRQKTARIII